MGFEWMGRAKLDRAKNHSTALDMYRREVAHRAALLMRLGHRRAHAAHVIAENLKWEFELLGGVPIADEVEEIVTRVFARGGQ
ncbi:MAG: hypothetical protein HYV07_00295 [Deltaproteobacteria bacterium]|nr:hypothetical protein [Deltaproteobacteria bacterium]